MNETVKIWNQISLSDLDSSFLLYENGHYRNSYFLFQQASEKANKAFALLGGKFTLKDLEHYSHDQLKIFKKISVSQEGKINELIQLLEPYPKNTYHKLFENTNFIEYRKSLLDEVSFIDSLKNYDLVNISIKDLNFIIKSLIKLKETQLKIPLNFDSIFKSKMFEVANWIGQFATENAKEEKANFEKFINDEEKLNQLYNYMINYLFPMLIDSVFIYTTLYFCAIITVQHSSLTRYPKDNINPNLIYTKQLPIVKKQKYFMTLLQEAILKINRINNKKPDLTIEF